MRQRQMPTRSNLPVGVTVERSSGATLHKSDNHDLVHYVTRKDYEIWLLGGPWPKAYCGYDTTGRQPAPEGTPVTCVVCIDIANNMDRVP